MDRVAASSSLWEVSDSPTALPATSSSREEAKEREREMMRLKIYTDTLMRDLIVMEDAVTRAQAIHSKSMKPDVLPPIPTMW